jgi:hypothetical protein
MESVASTLKIVEMSKIAGIIGNPSSSCAVWVTYMGEGRDSQAEYFIDHRT